jgi:hypothetical protein
MVFIFDVYKLHVTDMKQKLTWDLTIWECYSMFLGEQFPCFKGTWFLHLQGQALFLECVVLEDE